jgi:hypothetical protein
MPIASPKRITARNLLRKLIYMSNSPNLFPDSFEFNDNFVSAPT